MQISSNTWHYRIFDWWFKETHHTESFASWYGSGKMYSLCPYVRAVLFWGPGLFIITPPRLWYTLGVIFSLLTEANFHYHGLLGLKLEGAALGILGGAFIVLFGLIWLVEYLQERAREKRIASESLPESSFIVIFSKYFKSLHDDICPSVTFESNDQIDTEDSPNVWY